ncbi:MAG: hypothetical protein KGZ79_12025 [Dethiobacter sp.]|jgi:hypothetical protein|nr:hypothetical protein [Dethiobacter sp.]
MGKKEKELVSILTKNGACKIGNMPIPALADRLLYGSLKEEVLDVYRKLGGIEGEYAFRGKWDIVTEKYIVELDEQLHFNDYRLTTLESPLYDAIKKFPLEAYREYCRRYKENCLRAGSNGGKWTNASCEKMFGPAQQNGDLTGYGSPRWKQRAFYDYLKDISYLATNIPVVRLSIYDSIDYRGRKYALGDLLESNHTISDDLAVVIQELIDMRL